MKRVTLETSIADLFMVGKNYVSRLKKLEINTVNDLLHHYPFRHEDWSVVSTINQLQTGERVSIKGTISKFENVHTRYGRKIQKGSLNDSTGQIDFIFFNQPFLNNVFKIGQKMSLAGIVESENKRLIFKNPQYEFLKTDANTIHTARLVPVYPETAGVSSKWLRSRIAPILNKSLVLIKDWLPPEIQAKQQLVSLNQALKDIHFPPNLLALKAARKRLGFDELFLLQTQSLIRRQEWKEKGKAIKLKAKDRKISQLIKGLPFKLTNDQNKCIGEILHDLYQEKAANRLIQGDVGVGKTIVAAIAIYLSFLNGKKSLLMAPTEILAQQHYKSLKKLFLGSKMNVSFISSSRKKLDPEADLIIGTHALLHRKALKQPALLIIDEQHRFGVAQRSALLKFKKRPHLITMTATPIPRTISLAFYGDLDLSVIKQVPKGRKKVKTWVVPAKKRNSAYKWIEKEIKKSQSQAFIICPLIEESEHEKLKDIKAASIEHKRLSEKIFPRLKLALLHGRIKANKKTAILKNFRAKKYHILVATPVVEVGIDIPNANIILIEGAQRFGLAQLHQLRGRVGRGEKQAYCLLFTSDNKQENNRRLKALETHFSGFSLAEIDLKIRGPGETYGQKQSGFKQLKIASFDDSELLIKARSNAQHIFKNLNQFPLLQEKIKKLTINDVKPN